MFSEAIRPFLEDLERSGLLSTGAAQEAVARWVAEADLSAEQLAARLVADGLLTPFQAEVLLARRGPLTLAGGRYYLLEKLGEGGMGAVFKARDTKLERVVALKILPPVRLFDPDAIARFRREALALARLSHPNIIQAFDSGDDAGHHFLVMEYVEGMTLDRVLRRQGALPPTVAADWIYQAALGLKHAHEKGLIHRDLKPANLFAAGYGVPAPGQPPVGTGDTPAPSQSADTVTYRARPGSEVRTAGRALIKILDLGLARFLQDQLADGQLTQEGMGVGTPDYMAPEQFRDALRADVRTDVYGLGCTLYHLIAGQVPFPGSSHAEKADAHARREPVPLDERCPEMPGGLALVVERMMAKHPADRFQSAGAVADALSPFVAGGSRSMAQLRQTGIRKAAPKTMRASSPRRRLAWAGASVVVALLVIVFATLLGPRRPESNNPDGVSGTPDRRDAPAARVVTIPNGLTVAQDGTGQYTRLAEALDHVRAGQTIRILDDAVYPELLSVGDRTRHAEITIEGVRRPTLEVRTAGAVGIQVVGIPAVTIRGLKMRARASRVTLVRTQGDCSGLRLEKLDMEAEPGTEYFGVIFLGHGIPTAAGPPMVVRGCHFLRPLFGVGVEALGPDHRTGVLCSRVIVRENTVVAPSGYGILVRGLVRQVCVVGNRIRGPTNMSGIQFDYVQDDTEAVLFANNTIADCLPAFRFWDDAVRGRNIEFRNNITLGAKPGDMLFFERGPDNPERGVPGDAAAASRKWHFSHNWRESAKDVPGGKGWVPPTAKDVLKERIELLSLDPNDPNFLRPPAGSPLATAGAGGDLPGYVGAVPPEGLEPWDWERTWNARMGR